MVYSRTTYHCDRCRKGFISMREAESCQLDHIVTDAVDGFSAKLDEIFRDQKPAPTPDQTNEVTHG